MHPEDAAAEVERIMESVDTDGSGFIDYSEFIAATINKNKLLSSRNLEAAFQAFDKDHSGSISIDEVRQMLGDSVPDAASFEAMIKEVDADGNGEIDMNEFKNMMIKLF